MMIRYFILLTMMLALPGCAAPGGGVGMITPTPEYTQPAAQTMQESVYFDVQSSVLSEKTRATLMSLAMMVRMDKSLRVHVVGFTERTAKNPSLALRRAIAVRNVLSQMGVAPDRIDVLGETDSDTILSQQSPETGSNGTDRRVEITIEQIVGQAV